MNNIKVLVVDDNQELVSKIKEYFSDHANINVSLEAYDGEIALKLIKEYKSDYDVVILDLVMPKKDGLDGNRRRSEHARNKIKPVIHAKPRVYESQYSIDTLKCVAIDEAPSTSQSAPLIRSTNPTISSMIGKTNSIMLSFYF